MEATVHRCATPVVLQKMVPKNLILGFKKFHRKIKFTEEKRLWKIPRFRIRVRILKAWKRKLTVTGFFSSSCKGLLHETEAPSLSIDYIPIVQFLSHFSRYFKYQTVFFRALFSCVFSQIPGDIWNKYLKKLWDAILKLDSDF